MNLKNAVAVCLISFFSATLVLLIARALDMQAAARLEPQLARIVEELQAIRQQGGSLGSGAGNVAEAESVEDGLVVYYFHGNVRCPTCRSIESQTHAIVQSDFATELDSGKLTWKVVNYEEPAAKELAAKFEIQMPVVVLARTTGGQIQDWNRLDQVWGLVGDEPAFAKFVHDEIAGMLQAAQPQPTLAPDGMPTPATDSIPTPVADIPIPGSPPQTP